MKKNISYLFLSLFFLTGCASTAPASNNTQIPDSQTPQIRIEESAPAKSAAVEVRSAQFIRATSSEIKHTEPVEIQETKETPLVSNFDKNEEIVPVAAPNGTYTNVDGNEVPNPYVAPSRPAGASAICRDGSYSFSQHRSGTCSHHGGVAEWY